MQRSRGHSPHSVGLWPVLFVGPSVLGLIVLTLLTIVGALGGAFTQWNAVGGLGSIKFVGFRNFELLFTDPEFWTATGRTLIYTGFGVPIGVFGGMLVAIALNGPVLGRTWLRAIFYIPATVNVVAVGLVWLLALDPGSGPISTLTSALGVGRFQWLASSSLALVALIAIHVWASVGFNTIVYLAALQDMPADLYEAVMLDGAGPIRRFTTITWPGLLPTTTMLLILSFISSSQSFGLIAFLTRGGPGGSTTTLAYYLYMNAFQYFDLGYASAIGVIMFMILIVLSLIIWRFQRGRALYS